MVYMRKCGPFAEFGTKVDQCILFLKAVRVPHLENPPRIILVVSKTTRTRPPIRRCRVQPRFLCPHAWTVGSLSADESVNVAVAFGLFFLLPFLPADEDECTAYDCTENDETDNDARGNAGSGR